MYIIIHTYIGIFIYIGVVNFILQLIQPVEGVPTKILIIIIIII